MIKVFTTNKNGKIEFTEKELKALLDEAFWDGYRSANHTTYTYVSPYTPYYWTTTTSGGTSTTITCNSADNTSITGTVTLSDCAK